MKAFEGNLDDVPLKLLRSSWNACSRMWVTPPRLSAKHVQLEPEQVPGHLLVRYVERGGQDLPRVQPLVQDRECHQTVAGQFQ
jgi:hypothetical protein